MAGGFIILSYKIQSSPHHGLKLESYHGKGTTGIENLRLTYKLHNLNRTRLENIFHRLFGAAQLDLTIEDRFGRPSQENGFWCRSM